MIIMKTLQKGCWDKSHKALATAPIDGVDRILSTSPQGRGELVQVTDESTNGLENFQVGSCVDRIPCSLSFYLISFSFS